jgi:antitoxin VapB
MQKAKLFKNGQSQAVRLPKEFRFEGDCVYIKKVGNSVMLIPEKGPWDSLFKSLEMFSPDFMEDREQPPVQERDLSFE